MFSTLIFFINSKNFKYFIKKVSIVLFWLLIWQLVSATVSNNILIVGPVDTLIALFNISGTSSFWISIFNTLIRTIGGFLAASLISIFIAFFAYYFNIIKELLDPFINLIKAVPVASYVILVLIWLRGSNMLSFVIAFLVVFPVSYISILNGLMSTDKKLLEVAKIFHISFLKKLKYIYIPTIKPFLLSSFETTIGMSFKSGIAAELIGQPQNTIGFYLYQSKVFLDTSELFAWTFVIVILSYGFEKLCTLLIKHYFKLNEVVK